ncbi:TetR family transcriptional regulator [Yinghuangia seranimata]|uniref:TetR family transcriptional regulator n=1 Tax=Yinghuangia seranimata TaxID=408067 RepID=UPI00248C2A53|nr:TetR family transcriptional regulator [Yinghuangia seranimata]MDI2128439.1 TetR family transcriptional regulator [Yinghuangia seranimata]
MADAPLTSEQILEAAEGVLRRYGPAKATVVDVARALGVSHGTVYRHFPSKAALREAVTRRWLDRTHATLTTVVASESPAEQRLREWLETLYAAKRSKALDDPELFAAYSQLVEQTSSAVEEHLADLIAQLTGIIQDGIDEGAFATTDPVVAADAVFSATARFHDPVYARYWTDPATQTTFENVCDLVLAGLAPRV